MSERVVVVGAGVIGLTCAVRLAEQGYGVAVLARDLPLETTSAIAAAIWYPYRAYPYERVTGWSATTYAELARLAEDPETGVRMREGTEVLTVGEPTPWWAEAVPDLRAADELPRGYAAGWSFAAPVVEMRIYLGWLLSRLEELGGTVTRMAFADLPQDAPLLVNTSGLGARRLAGDSSVDPVRGQVVRVSQVGIDRWWLDSHGPTYVVPRSEDIVVGGTEEEGEWDRTPDPAVARSILARAGELVPELKRAEILGHRVGLRPGRPSVRLETSVAEGGGRIVHCYGHGGAGVTLSWGCAEEVVSLLGRPA